MNKIDLETIDTKLYSAVEYTKDLEVVLVTTPENLENLLLLLRDCEKLRFKILADIVGIDYLLHEQYHTRFAVKYNLLSVRYNFRIFVAIYLNANVFLPSVHKIFSSASWLEREVFDMFGLHFKNALDSRRILTDYGFKHYPLRKDYPLSGYEEIRYNPESEKVEYKPVNLEQDFRNFDFKSPFIGPNYQIKLENDSK